MAAPRNWRGRRAALGSEPQVWSTTLPCHASLPFPCLANSRATSVTAESEVEISKTDAPSNRGSPGPTGLPLPMNRTARRAAAALRAATNTMGTRDCARRRPIACPTRPGPMMATPRSDWCFLILGFRPGIQRPRIPSFLSCTYRRRNPPNQSPCSPPNVFFTKVLSFLYRHQNSWRSLTRLISTPNRR